MALRLRKRKSDSREVQVLFDLHKLLNHGGRRWIKGAFYRRGKGKGMCYCLSGGVNKVAPTKALNTRVRNLLSRTIYNRYRYSSIVAFNDRGNTTWTDVEAVIRSAIEEGRKQI